MASLSLSSNERRKSQRRNAKGKIFVLFDQHRTQIGQLIDICQEGLCCIAMKIPHLKNVTVISLAAYGEEEEYSVIQSIPLHEMQLETSDSGKKVLKIRLHFATLSKAQRRALAAFLRIHTGPSRSEAARIA